jgi:excisionase family DNA binding protein
MLSDSIKLKIKNLPAILSIRETADFCSVSYLTVYRLILKGKLPAWKDDEGSWCVARSDLLKFCSRNSNL